MRGYLFLLLLVFMGVWVAGGFNWMDRKRMEQAKRDPFNEKNWNLLPSVRLGYAVPFVVAIIALVIPE